MALFAHHYEVEVRVYARRDAHWLELLLGYGNSPGGAVVDVLYENNSHYESLKRRAAHDAAAEAGVGALDDDRTTHLGGKRQWRRTGETAP